MKAIILARGGSKSIPRKNLVLLDNKPLISYTIKAALDSRSIKEVIVSSDDDDILNLSIQMGAKTIRRPDNLAQDFSTSADGLFHVLINLKGEFSEAILLQPTSPFRTSKHIDEAYSKFKAQNLKSLISVKSIDNKILKSFVSDDNGYLSGIRNNEFPFMPRQSLPQTYMPNGAIYIVNIKDFLKHKTFLQHPCGFYLMNDEDSFDIDTMQDLKEAQMIILNKKDNLKNGLK